MSNSLTLGMVATQLPPSLAKVISKPIMQATDMLPIIPYKGTSNQFHLTRLQDVSVPTPGWRQFNQDAPNPTRGIQRVETRWAGMLDFVIKVDKRLASQPSQWEDHRTAQIRLHGIGAAFEAQRVFFKGNHLSVIAEPDGMQAIFMAGIASTDIPSANLINAGTGGATLTFALLDQTAYACYGNNRKWMMNPFLHRKILSLARDAATSGILRISDTRNMLGKPFLEYNGMPLLIIERMDDHTSDLPFDENDGSGNLDTASIWLANFSNEGDQGIFAFGPDSSVITAEGFKDIPGTPFSASYTSWAIGFMIAGPTGVARLYHLNQA